MHTEDINYKAKDNEKLVPTYDYENRVEGEALKCNGYFILPKKKITLDEILEEIDEL